LQIEKCKLQIGRTLALIIRSYQPADLPLLKAITVEAFTGVSIDHGIEEQFGPINGYDWKWRKARHLDDDAARDPTGIFVRGAAPSVISLPAGLKAASATFEHRHRRNCGQLGRSNRACSAHFRASGLTHAKIEALAQNAVGNHLYRDLGFVEVARQVHFVAKL
jgi:hypothetical protein